MGAPSGPGSRATHRAAKASRPKASIPSAARRRTFKPFDKVPRDGTAFHVAMIVRFNPFAKTFEALYRDQFSGELSWEAKAGIWRSHSFCDLLPLSIELPKSFAMAFVATPARRPTWRERLTNRLFGWLRVPDPISLMQYCASAIEARSDAAPQSDAAEGESAAAAGGDAQ